MEIPQQEQTYYQKHRKRLLIKVREYRKNNLEKTKKSQHEYYLKNRGKILKSVKQYRLNNLSKRRITQLTCKGKYIGKLHKRPYTGYCEICGKIQDKRLVYHHWNDEILSMGIWVCNPCHWFIEGIERGLQLKKYLDLKNKISKKYIKIGNILCIRSNSF